jgi:mRNA interferase MazF
VARRVGRGEIWLHRFAEPDKRRPVLVLSRPSALTAIRTAIVAPVTSTIRGLPSEVPLGIDDGMKQDCAVNLDHVQTVHQDDLRVYVATLTDRRLAAVCRALAVATGCG